VQAVAAVFVVVVLEGQNQIRCCRRNHVVGMAVLVVFVAVLERPSQIHCPRRNRAAVNGIVAVVVRRNQIHSQTNLAAVAVRENQIHLQTYLAGGVAFVVVLGAQGFQMDYWHDWYFRSWKQVVVPHQHSMEKPCQGIYYYHYSKGTCHCLDLKKCASQQQGGLCLLQAVSHTWVLY